MMSISQLARDLKESATLAMTEKARILREKGEPVISMAAGEPKSKAPIDAIMACAAKLTVADVHYTPTQGVPALVKAIIRYTEDNYGKVIGPDNVMATAGAKQAFYNLMITLLNPQDEVVILAPYWVSYPEIVKLVYGKPVIVQPEDGRFVPRMEDIERAVGSYTKVIVVNSPNNPSGAVYPPELIAELVEFCEKKEIYLVMDDIYHKLVFNGVKAVSCYDYAKDDSDNSRLIVINGVSKSYAMTGFRIGWVIANKKVTAAMVNVAGQNMTCPSVVLQAAAVGALNGIQSGVEGLRLTLQNNCDIMMAELNSFTGVRCIPPDGTFYCLPDFRAYEKDDVKLAQFLL
ncbi:MAG: aminotransferase class I/II-fold pyridoxal phosphate-dependent enzyme, partial [candidate division Zixibacteria bacterium]|nr:aminotransferase class I/II-fold pyridoxal phosphate-dependent enzyme [candidate division Zixibacteria bacterium]